MELFQHNLRRESKDKPIEDIQITDFREIKMIDVQKASLITFKRGNKLKILKNRFGHTGIETVN